MDSKNETRTDISGYDAAVGPYYDPEGGQTSCQAAFAYRPLDFPDSFGSTEFVRVQAWAPVSQDETCDLTTAAADRLLAR